MFTKIFKKKYKSIIKVDKSDLDFTLLESSLAYHEDDNRQVDFITANDLNINELYYKIMRTVSSAGDDILYKILHRPLKNEEELNKRMALIDSLADKEEELKAIRGNLAKTGRLKYDFKDTIKSNFTISKWEKYKYLFLGILPLVVLAYSLVSGKYELLAFLFMLALFNGYQYYKFEKEYQFQIQSLLYLLNLINSGKYIIRKHNDLASLFNIRDKYNDIRSYSKKISSMLGIRGNDFAVFLEYINIIFLVKPISYSLICSSLHMDYKKIFAYYDEMGRLDAYISIYLYKKESTNYCKVNFNGGPTIKGKAIYHPLLKDPVANDVNFDRGVIITGSNMSGKSTFLRTLGVNLLVAQTLGIAYAEEFSCPFMPIISSISLKDDIFGGISYYMQEALAIKRMLDYIKEEGKCLILIDEIFKGTNPIERIAAASEICNNLNVKNVLPVIATHDLDLIVNLVNYDKYYFTEKIGQDEISFPYKIYKGIASTRNAIKILEYLNYPREITDKINERLDREDSGISHKIWDEI